MERLAKANTLQQELSDKVTKITEQLDAAERELQDVIGKEAEVEKALAAVREMAAVGSAVAIARQMCGQAATLLQQHISDPAVVQALFGRMLEMFKAARQVSGSPPLPPGLGSQPAAAAQGPAAPASGLYQA